MSAWTSGNYTKKGLALLTKLTHGASLKITRAVTGTGYVQPSVLANQTGVTGIKQTLKFMAASYPETGVCKLPMFITNEGLTAKYTAKQIGIYALDPDVGEILYFIAQSEDGTIVPSESVMPEYSSTWTFYFRYGQADNVSVTVDPSHTITEDMLNEVRIIAETGVSDAKHGGALVVDNTANLPFVNLKLFGKSTQSGTPTPDAPADIVSAGDGGNINIGVYRKNLCPANAFDTMSSNGSNNTYDASTHKITFNAASTAQYGRYYPPIKNLIIGKAYTISFDIKGTSGKIVYCGWSRNNVKIKLTGTYTRYSCTIIAATKGEQVIFYTEKTASGGLASGEYMQFANVQIEMTEAATEYEAYKTPQTMSVGGVLAGIPVSSGGNYTDTDGQQWLCDEIDFERGVKVQRVRKMTMNSGDSIQYSLSSNTGRGQIIVSPNVTHTKNQSIVGVMCNLATKNPVPLEATDGEYYENPANIVLVGEMGESEESIKAKYATLEVLYILTTPIETALSFAELEAYNALTSNNPHTTIINDGGANMEADCFLAQHETAFERIFANANTKAKKATEITDNAVAMVKDVHEDSAPYAKVLEIGGVTRKCTNLLYLPDTETDVVGVHVKIVGGAITISGTATASGGRLSTLGLVTLRAGTYVSRGNGLGYFSRTTDNMIIGQTNGIPFTLEGETTLKFGLNFTAGTAYSEASHVTLNEGTEPLPYEPYFDGLRSAPVTEVESVGRNLIPFPYAHSGNRTTQGVTYSVDVEGKISAKGTWSGTTPAWHYLYDDSNGFVMPKDGILRFTITNNNSGARLKPSVTINGKAKYDESSVKVSEGDVITRIAVYTDSSTEIAIDSTATVMLNYGTTALPYTPYVRNTLPIPAEVQALDGYGWGVNDEVYNYIDWEKKQFVKRVGCVDLGTLEWGTDTGGLGSTFRTRVPNFESAHDYDSRRTGWLCGNYSASTSNAVSHLDNKTALRYIETIFYVRDDDYNDTTTFKAAMSGVMLCYELAEPVITDISDLLPDDNLIGVEDGGTVTMVNEYGFDTPNTVGFSIGNNAAVGSRSFVGDLHGTAARAKADAEGKPLATQEWVLEQLASLAAATLALNQ